MVSAFDSAITAPTFADEKLAALFSDAAEIRACIRFEGQLALVQESLGVIPAGSGKAIAEALEKISVDPASLAASFRRDGIVIPGLIAALREQLPDEVAGYLHHGATSQDAMDTGLVLRLKDAVNILQQRRGKLDDQLRELIHAHRDTLTIARTRNQNAAPTVFGLKLVNWLQPLQRQGDRLEELLPRLLVVQVGGAAGTLAALGPRGPEVNAVLAEALELNPAHAPWHVQRDNLVEFGNWLSLTAGILGKMGQDMLLLSQSDVGEIGFRSGGKSSTLPNKNNPVAPEFLVSLARYSQQQAGALAQSVLAGGERDGVSMTLESLTLAPLVCAAGAAMKLASEALADMEIVSETMARNIDADRGRMLAEAATFELSRFMERGEASALVARACRLATENETHMIDELSKLTQAEADWQALKELRNHLGAAQQIIDRALKS